MTPSTLSSREAISTHTNFTMVFTISLMLMIFLVDLQLPLGVAGGVPYVAIVLLTLWLPSSSSTWIFAMLCSVLTVLGLWWFPPGDELWQVVANRALALFTIWTTALLSIKYKQFFFRLQSEGLAFRSMMDLMPHVVFARNAEGRMLASNHAARTFMGRTHEEFQEDGRQALYPSSEEECLARERDEVQLRNAPSLTEYTEAYTDKQGRKRVFKATKFPFIWPETGELVLATVAVDETERLEQLEKLKLTERVVDCSSDHISIVGKDYRCRRVNPAFEKAHGIVQQDIVGVDIQDLFGSDIFHQIVKPRFDQCLQGQNVHYEDWFLFGQQDRRYMAMTYTPLKDENGHIDSVMVIFKDLTDRGLSDEGVAYQASLLSFVIDCSTDAIFVKDLAGKYLKINSAGCQLIGRSHDQVVGNKDLEIFGKEIGTAYRQFDQQVMSEGTATTFEDTLTVEGKPKVFSTMKAPLRNLRGNISGLIGVARDITERKLAETTLQESEARLQAILDNSPGLIFLKDLNGRYLHVNQQFKQVFGLREEDVISRTDDEVFSSDQASQFQAHDRQVMESRELLEFEEVGMHHDGPHTSIVHKFPLFNEKGEMFAVGGITTDITERKKMEQQLRETQNFALSIIENLPNMVFVKEAKDLRFVRINQAGESLVGYSREELLGKNDYNFFPQKEADFFTAHDRAVLQGGKLVDIPEETIHTCKKGIRILHTKKIPLYDQQGRPEYLLGISEDITSKRLAEKELEKSQKAYADLVNSVEGIVWECEFPSYQFTFVNQQAQRLLGYPIEQWFIEPGFFGNHLHPEDREWALEYCFRETTAKQAHEIEYRMIASDGRVVWLRDLVTVVVENDQPVKVRGIMVDITERKRLEEKICQYNKELESEVEKRALRIQELEQRRMQVEKLAALAQVAAGVAHEINNPLASIGQSLELLRRAIPEDHPRYRYTGKIQDAVDRMAHIVKQLYGFYKPDSTAPSSFDVVPVVHHAIEIMKERSTKKEVKISCVLPKGQVMVTGQRSDLIQVLCNLIQNGLDVCPSGREIQIGLGNETRALILTVSDQGPGIKSEIAPYVFDPFFTTKEGRSSEGGMGLGLAVSYRLVQAMGGSLDFTTQLGHGTTFRITFSKETV